MRNAPAPTGYDRSYVIDSVAPACQVAVGFDRYRGEIRRFLVRLYHALSSYPLRWTAIARFDHNGIDETGHDIYVEGIHIDVSTLAGETYTLHPSHQPIPQNTGIAIRWCVDYFEQFADWFVDVFMGVKSATDPPDWPA